MRSNQFHFSAKMLRCIRATFAFCCILIGTVDRALCQEAIQVNLASQTAWTFRGDTEPAPAKSIPVPAGGWRLNGFPDETSGTYERNITVPKLAGSAPQVTLLSFEAVNWEAVVSVGPDTAHLRQAAIHLSAWTPFTVDISKFVVPGRSAVVRVHVRDRTSFTDAGGHFTVPAGPEWNDRAGRGILRGVSLTVAPALYITDVAVKPSSLHRSLTYTVFIRNTTSTPMACKITGSLSLSKSVSSGPINTAIAAQVSGHYPSLPVMNVVVGANQTQLFTVGPVSWPLSSRLDWRPNVPYVADFRTVMHQLNVQVASPKIGSVSGKASRFGFCSMTQSGTRYMVNGIPFNLRGDSLPEGSIGTDAFARLPGFLPPATGKNGGWPTAVRNYQRLNFNVIRMHQVPCTRYMMDVCDDLGMLVIPETAIRGGGISPENVTERPEAFTEHIRELVERDRNHPSVVKWSLENELVNVPTEFLKKLYDTCMKADGTRPCSIDVFDKTPHPGWPDFAIIDHYTQAAGFENASGGVDRPGFPRGEGEYVWPFSNKAEGPNWVSLETRSMRRFNNSDLRPYTFIDVWPSVIPGLTPTNFPDPHLPPDSLEQGGRSLLNPLAPWNNPLIRLIQRSFAPVAAFDVEYDNANMHTNGKGDWPTTVPTLKGGTTNVRQFEVFNDEVMGAELQLVVLPILKISDADNQPLPEISKTLHIAPGSHAAVSIPLPAPIVAHCTALEVRVSVFKNGKAQFQEVLPFVVNPNGKGSASVAFIGIDTITKSDWVNRDGMRKYGQQAFFLPIRGGRSMYQEPSVFVRRAAIMIPGDDTSQDLQDDNSDTQVSWESSETSMDVRIPWSGPGRTERQPVAFIGPVGKFFFRLDCADAASHQLSFYLMNYKKTGLGVDVEIFDTQGHRLDSRKLDGASIDEGVYTKYKISGSVYISFQSLSNQLVTVSGVFVDPI